MLCLATACVLLVCPAQNAWAGLSDTQRLYLKVEKDLQKKRRNSFLRHEAQLRSYPLYPYLQTREYELRIGRLKDGEIIQFLSKYEQTPMADRLRQAWLYHLRDKRQWDKYQLYYQESLLFPNKELACYYGQALMHQADLEKFIQTLEKLWLVNFSQPRACDRVFNWARAQGLIGDQLIWERILLTFDKKQSLARYLARSLSQENRHWYRFLREAKAKPEATLRKLKNQAGLKYDKALRDVVAYTLMRLARTRPGQTERLWTSLANQYEREERNLVQRKLGITLLHRLHSEHAYRLLAGVAAIYHDTESRTARVRAAIHLDDHRKISESIAALTTAEREEPQWDYWWAYSLQASGKRQQATRLWSQMAQQAGYYNFLAADELGQPYRFATHPPRFTEQDLRELQKTPRIARMRELITLGHYTDARREFFLSQGALSQTDYLKLAVLTDRWGWHDGAIRSIAHSGIQGETHLRFPLAYLDLIEREAKRYKWISSEMVLGLIRRESAFIEKIKSPAGALGLMQVMPATARVMLRELKLKRASTWGILRPGINIRLGVAYLAKLYRRYHYNFAEALAAYNAGGTAVHRWKQARRSKAPLVWLETIPYTETRHYVRAVLYYTTVYAHRLGKKPQRLSSRMRSGRMRSSRM